jgi:tetratricopeptide (TPR) repeat protein
MSHAIARGLVLAALWGALATGIAEARNPHCAGGIQYVVQAIRDKDKGNTEDYDREINKAVQQLEICRKEDPADYEAIGYLGWAYADIESAGPAGKAFAEAIQGFQAKGDAKKADWATSNRASYWARWFNDGIGKIQAAQQAYADFCVKPKDEAEETLKGEAQKSYREAEASLSKALQLVPGEVKTTRNLASVYAFQCEFPKADAVLREGLKAAPGDSTLVEALRMVRINMANTMVNEKRYDEAVAFYAEQLKSEPGSADLHLSLADVYFRRAQSNKDDAARKADFRLAGDEYAKAAELRPDDADVAFNSALAYQNAGLWDRAEPMWAKTTKLRPDDTDALMSWGSVLIELKRCDEAINAIFKAVSLKPQDRVLHRQLGAAYTRCGNNAKGTEELMVFLALSKGQAVPDAAAQAKEAKQGTEAAKTLASEGVPEQIYQWEADEQKWETWFYWAKKRAVHFNLSNSFSQKSDWSAPVTGAARKK